MMALTWKLLQIGLRLLIFSTIMVTIVMTAMISIMATQVTKNIIIELVIVPNLVLERRDHQLLALEKQAHPPLDLEQQAHPHLDLEQQAHQAPDLELQVHQTPGLVKLTHQPPDLEKLAHLPLDLEKQAHGQAHQHLDLSNLALIALNHLALEQLVQIHQVKKVHKLTHRVVLLLLVHVHLAQQVLLAILIALVPVPTIHTHLHHHLPLRITTLLQAQIHQVVPTVTEVIVTLTMVDIQQEIQQNQAPEPQTLIATLLRGMRKKNLLRTFAQVSLTIDNQQILIQTVVAQRPGMTCTEETKVTMKVMAIVTMKVMTIVTMKVITTVSIIEMTTVTMKAITTVTQKKVTITANLTVITTVTKKKDMFQEIISKKKLMNLILVLRFGNKRITKKDLKLRQS